MKSHDELFDTPIASATAPKPTQAPQKISLHDAMLLGEFAKQKALEMNLPVVFCLVDASGHQRYFFSMEDALLVSHTVAVKKAWTAVALKMSTQQLAQEIQPGKSLYTLQNDASLCCFGGGIPLWSGNLLVGALGISGGSVEQDVTVAQYAVTQFSQRYYSLLPA
ncbi:heme-binding protein [Vibrio tritonius]|uniref:Heme-binding protein n=1 Tax=Vibrio tritonius TaxID=1435069 RepID=A0ABS7YR83_9VIBR|nr:heme-binding protein [Vibrio tritonius]MCA2018197.1 heme-binding protein [Vibrio tritonius]